QSIARTVRVAAAVALVVSGSLLVSAQEPSRGQGGGFSFRTAWDLVTLNATVTDTSGHAVAGLRAEDFIVYEDGERQTVSQFEAERVPASLGLTAETRGATARGNT